MKQTTLLCRFHGNTLECTLEINQSNAKRGLWASTVCRTHGLEDPTKAGLIFLATKGDKEAGQNVAVELIQTTALVVASVNVSSARVSLQCGTLRTIRIRRCRLDLAILRLRSATATSRSPTPPF